MTAQSAQAASILYISYDGVLEPLGQSQVLAYLTKLSPEHRIYLISFEKQQDWSNRALRSRVEEGISSAGILWLPLRYHKRPSAVATSFDILQGMLAGAYLTLRYRIGIVHARSYVASVMALALKKLFGLKFVFDMRGFWADERVAGGLWRKNSRLYRAAKWFERWFLLSADRVVSLTHAAVDEMRKFPYLQGRMPAFEVITTCTDLDLFTPGAAGASGQPGDRPFTVGYVGSVGSWYLFDETLRSFRLLQQRTPGARLHILNRGDHAYIRERLEAGRIDPQAVRLEAMDRAGVARSMLGMDAGVFFYKPSYSCYACAPTRLGEFLACGVPSLVNAGIGDMAGIVEGKGVGIALKDFGEASMRSAIDALLQLARDPGTRSKCRQVAMEYFSLDMGVRKYADIYRQLRQETRALPRSI